MLYYDELKEAIDRGFIKGDTVQIVRKNGIVFGYVLSNELVEFYELAVMHVKLNTAGLLFRTSVS